MDKEIESPLTEQALVKECKDMSRKILLLDILYKTIGVITILIPPFTLIFPLVIIYYAIDWVANTILNPMLDKTRSIIRLDKFRDKIVKLRDELDTKKYMLSRIKSDGTCNIKINDFDYTVIKNKYISYYTVLKLVKQNLNNFNADLVYTITWKTALRGGVLAINDRVELVEGMEFIIARTASA